MNKRFLTNKKTDKKFLVKNRLSAPSRSDIENAERKKRLSEIERSRRVKVGFNPVTFSINAEYETKNIRRKLQ